MTGYRLAAGFMYGFAALGLMAANSAPAWAGRGLEPSPAEPAGPRIKGEVSVELQSDHTYKSDDPDPELRDTYNTTEVGLEVLFTDTLTAHGAFTFEPVLDPGPGEDRFFEDQGLYAEELYGRFALGRGVSVLAGKYNPTFGTAWDLAPGVYGTDFAEDYETTERLGFAAAIERNAGGLGAVTLTGNVYRADTSNLSRSAFTDRGKTRLSDGGPSNTDGLESFSATLDAADAPVLAGNNLHMGYRFQKQGETAADLEDEHGYVFGLNGARDMNGVGFGWIGEVVYLDNAEGTRDELWYYTLGGLVTFARKYNIAVSYTGRPRDVAAGGPDFDDRQLQVSAGMVLGHGWTLDAGYKYHVEEDVDNHTVGVLLARGFSFGQ